MQLTHEHEQIRDTLKRYIAEHINPHVDEWEEAEIFPAHQVFKGLGDLGLLGLTKPVEYGGMGLDYSYSMVMAETLGLINCGGVPMAIGVQTDMCTPALARFGSEELKREFLAPAIAGDMVGCIGVSEPGAGSDVSGIKTTARKDGDDYVITGQKMWITNSLQADWMCMLVNTGGDNPHKNKSLILVPMREGPGGPLRKGISVARKIRKIGMHSSDTGLIHFDEVRVPQRNLIGAEGQGFIYQMQQFQEERLWAAANALSALDGCIRDTIEWARERKMFGATLLDQQWVQFKLVELQTEVEALRGLTWMALRALRRRRRRAAMGQHGQAQGRAADARGGRRLPAVLGRHGLRLGEQCLAPVPRRPPGLHRRRRRRGDDGHHRQDHGHGETPGSVT